MPVLPQFIDAPALSSVMAELSAVQSENALVVQRAQRLFARAFASFEAETEPVWRGLRNGGTEPWASLSDDDYNAVVTRHLAQLMRTCLDFARDME
ncbi:MAG: hypothetical protein IPG04_38065 [Polyangiaceae bacterium]|nr:hypothetical protein [Polyangiaceae bacterium]